VKSELAIKLYGDELETLKAKADEIAGVVRGISGAADVQAEQVTGAPQMRIRPDREALSRYGIDLDTVQHLIRNAVGGTTAGQVYDGIRRFDIYARYQEQFRDDAESIGDILVEAPGGEEIPLSQLATIETLEGPRQISREDAQRYITVQANVTGRDIGGFVEEAQAAIDQGFPFPLATGWIGAVSTSCSRRRTRASRW